MLYEGKEITDLKSTWIVTTILIAILFFFTVYPTIDVLGDIPGPFQVVFRVLLFIAILSLLIFLLTEIHTWYRRYHELTTADQLTKKGSEESIIIELRHNLDTSENFQQLTNQLVEVIYTSLMARTVVLYLFNPQENQYVLQAHSAAAALSFFDKYPAEGELFKNLHQHSKATLYQSGQIHPSELRYYLNPPKVGTLILAPVLVNNSYVGFIGIDSIDQEAWGNEDLELVNSFAGLYANAILQIDIIDQQKNYIQFFRDLCQLNTEITLGIELHEINKQAASILKKFFAFDKLTFAFLTSDQKGELIIEYVEGSEADYTIGHEITVNKGVWEPLIKGAKPVLVNDYDKSKVEFRFQPNDLKLIPFRSALGIPLTAGNQQLGGILLESLRTKMYSKNDVETLSVFGKSYSAILNRLKIYQSLKDLAMIDGLTGIYNHRAFKERLQIEVERCRRYGNNLTLLILDLDKFKRINDTYGHLQGDYVLKKCASIIRSSVRTIDTVARYGGEEYAVILINADKKGCLQTAERICSKIQNNQFNHNGMTEQMTISIGMSEYPTDGEDGQAIIANADRAMYQAKRAGGNRVMSFEHES